MGHVQPNGMPLQGRVSDELRRILHGIFATFDEEGRCKPLPHTNPFPITLTSSPHTNPFPSR